ncbi:MAG: SPOR domain-containing protein [Bacteroidota bacterium]
MVKELVTLLAAAYLLIAAQPYNPRVTLETSVNSEVTAGTEFRVTVRIDKGNLNEYSRFSQELPYGLTAVNISSPNADFAFENQRVRIIWLKLPEENEITVEYKIKVHDRLKGKFSLGGEFAYIMDDERSFVRISPTVDLTILPKPGLDPALVVDISDFRNAVTPDQASLVVKDFAMAIRQEPEVLPTGEVLVHLIVRNPEGSTYMKVEEMLPRGYMFEEVESEGGIVSYAANQVRFIWMKQPAHDPMMITYKLVPKAGETQEAINLSGSFSYSANGKSETVPFKELAVNLTALSREQQFSLLQQGDIPQTAMSTKTQNVKPVEPTKTNETKTQTTKVTPATGSPYAAGLEFRVQIGAYHVQVGTGYFSRLGITMKVNEVREDGLNKYTIGPFSTYEQAQAVREKIMKENRIRDAFVVAYMNGKRITIKEARGR